jgi:DNA replication and repair protein RecF
MVLKAMELVNIRSYENGLFEFSEGVNIIVGPNASGKTNLLEAIHIVCQGKPFKSSDSDMIRRDKEWGRIDASFSEGERAVKLKKEPPEKLFVIDDIDKKRLLGNSLIPLVLFEPSHMLLLGGEPERRRNYIDSLLSQVEPHFKKILSSFKRVLAQRNRLLKQDNASVSQMFVWDVRLSELAGEIVEKRIAYVEKINDMFTENYRSVSGNNENLKLVYETKMSKKQYANSLLQRLKSSFELDRLRGFTGFGPHRDDLSVLIDGNEARQSASRGETRSIVLALKIAELDLITEKTGKKPLLLLDDVFGELDGKRRRMLAQTMKDNQTFITTTDADAIVKSFMADYNVITIS